MDYFKFILDSVRHRQLQIKCEIDLLKGQIKTFSCFLPSDNQIFSILRIRIAILTAVFKIYQLYSLEMKKNLQENSCFYFKKILGYHYLSMGKILEKNSNDDQKRKNLSHYLSEIEEHQKALQTFLRINPYKKDKTIEESLESTYYFFPYGVISNILLENNLFFSNILKIAIRYNPNTNHKESLKSVFNLLLNNKLNEVYDKLSLLSISEILLNFFAYHSIDKSITDKLKCLQFSERCKLLVLDNLSSLSINQKFIHHIEENLKWNNVPESSIEKFEELEEIKDMPNEYPDDSNSPIPCIHHIVLELRKIAIQPSVSMINYILLNVMDLINNSICSQGEIAGADESFPFFVAALSDARLFRLPSIIKLIEKFTVLDLRATKLPFLSAQLSSAYEFIQSRPLNVPPYVLFPFKSCSIPELQCVSEEPVKLPGFKVYAYPRYKNSLVPAVLKCTGKNYKEAIVYRFVLNDIKNALNYDFLKNTTTVATIHGNLLYNKLEKKQYDEMIIIDGGDYHEVENIVTEFSNLMKMQPHTILKPKLIMYDKIKEEFNKNWNEFMKMNNYQTSYDIIKEVQNSLKEMKILNSNHKSDGVLDEETVKVLQEFLNQSDLKLLPRDYKSIVSKTNM